MIIDYKLEKIFPLMFLIIGITLILAGIFLTGMNLLISTNSTSFIGILTLLIGVIIVFMRKGTLFDFDKKRIKHYVGLFFIKIGKWDTTENYSFISVLHLNQKSIGYSRTGVQFSEKNKIFRIYLLNRTHREKLKITDFNDLKNADLEANKIARIMNIEFVKYNPI
ncbi:hypothetical protein [Lutibacter citreus]|uniref:hypothetical protein n=1 Tax=Lutibacter citreus TaxID=2138210 RepID=UPI000DBE606A|nr:hypothetical protein [Lutibacter citreus]